VNNNNNSTYSIPPLPLDTALMIFVNNAIDKSVLPGYNDTFHPSYIIHLDNYNNKIDINTVGKIATLVARAEVALACNNGLYDSDSTSEYALVIVSL